MFWLLIGFTLALSVLAPVLPVGHAAQACTFVALFIGLPLSFLPAAPAGDRAESIALILSGGMAGWVWLTLFPPFQTGRSVFLLLILIGVGLAVFLKLRMRPSEPEPYQGWRQSDLARAILLVMFLFGLRAIDLSYKEVQGDEAIVLTRAAELLEGDPNTLYLHQKGPGEILLAALPWRLSAESTEFWHRLPFAWANILSLAILALFARRLYKNENISLIVLLLMSMMGFGLAFGRIVQYQSLVYLWSFSALLIADRLPEESPIWRRGLPGFFAGIALLAHYDAVLFVPAIAWFLAARRRPLSVRSGWGQLWPSAVAGAIVAGSFYIPYALHPNFQETVSYLVNDRVGVDGGGDVANGSLQIVWQMVTFYNSTPYVVGLIVLGLLGVWVTGRDSARRLRLAGLWLFAAVPLLFYTVVVADPRTHVYTFFPGVVILAAIGIQALLNLDIPIIARRVILAFALLWGGYSAQYTARLFLLTRPEIQRNAGVSPIAGDPKTWETPPPFGLFGFPYRAGWHSLETVIPADAVYRSNEEPAITEWYLPGREQTGCDTFDYFILAEQVQDEVAYDPARIDGLTPVTTISISDRQKMIVYADEASGGASALIGDRNTRWMSPASQLPSAGNPAESIALPVGDDVLLTGWTLNTADARPGGSLDLTVYWEATRPIGRNYQSFVHVVTDGLVAQSDRTPNCGLQPTSGWEIGRSVRDFHRVQLPETLQPDQTVTVFVGMYDLLTLERRAIAQPNDLFDVGQVRLGEADE